MKALYKMMNNHDKVTMKHFYHIICDPGLGEVFCAMQRILFNFTGGVGKLPNAWLPNLDKTLQPCYAIKPETCKYFSILRGYNK